MGERDLVMLDGRSLNSYSGEPLFILVGDEFVQVEYKCEVMGEPNLRRDTSSVVVRPTRDVFYDGELRFSGRKLVIEPNQLYWARRT
jgi:hypothetical protein